MLDHIISAAIGYLCGSIPFGLILSKAAGLGDVRNIGSRNIGATNVLRTGNKKIAALTLVCDALKGTLPVLLAAHYFSPAAGVAAGLGAMAGHIFPVWLGFKGGKGVATNIGVLFGLSWPLGIAFLAVWLAMAFLSRMSSLSALIASAVVPVAAQLFGRPDLTLVTIFMGGVIWITHRANIGRLLRREEPKIDLGKKS
jgi:acyl phosphate:glycerol-3-phosphate acyltransferase